MNQVSSKLARLTARYAYKALLPTPEHSIISFSFDDCPKTVVTNALPLLEANGWRATLYIACGLCGTTNHQGLHMSDADIIEAHKRGHEIADHTYSHVSANDVHHDVFLAEIERNQRKLEALGLPRSRHFAYPYGHTTPRLKQTLSKKFETMRGVLPPSNGTQDARLMKAVRIYSNDSISLALNEIAKAKDTPKWLQLFTHDIRKNPSDFGCTEEDFRMIVDAVVDSGLPVLTVDQAYQKIVRQERE
jgi:peptidoglycan/xylan/chitin deacetylase (PgdA/CDA1 family)